MWSLRNPFYLSATRFTSQQQRRRGEEGGEKKKKKNLQVQAWHGEDEYRRRILATKALREASRVLYGTDSIRLRKNACDKEYTSLLLSGRRRWGNVHYLCNYELNKTLVMV